MRRDKQTQRISTSAKNSNKKEWYKRQIDMLDNDREENNQGYGNVSETRRMKVNYDLYNNKLDTKDFEYVCKPYGSQVGELPAKMVNRDIISGKIKAMLGMEMKRPFSWKVIATNPEATTRREQEEFKMVREFVINQTMQPIKEEIELKYQQESKGKELGEKEIEEIKQKIAQETQTRTPEEIKKYMEREHQDPAEVLSHQLLEYLLQKCELKRKFNTAFKHGLISAKSVMYVGVLNGEPQVWNVNSMWFNCEKSSDTEFVEEGEWATVEYRMTPSEVIKYFGDELKDNDIDSIYKSFSGYNTDITDDNFYQSDNDFDDFNQDNNSVRVLHAVWKSLRKIGFLTYVGEDGQEQMVMVDEKYKKDEDAGDIELEWEWIPEVYEGWKIKASKPIYVNMKPIPGQFKDLENLHNCKLPYYGVIYDNMNSQETSLLDRLKVYQYYYNIIMYRMELLIASDKGKKVLMNINMIPDDVGIDIEKWQYFIESTPYMWYNPDEEGGNYADANTVAKVIDLSLVSDIKKYIEIAEYLRVQAGRSVGITDSVEGQTSAAESVRNAQQNLTQSSHILEYYFDLHGHVKKNVLQALLETSKIAYSNNEQRKLSYVLDDMSRKTLNLDIGLLENSTLGIFVSNSVKAEEAKELLRQVTHAAVQNQKIELSDIISVVRQDGIVEAEETLKVAEQKIREQAQAMEQQKAEQISALEDKRQQGLQKEHENRLEAIIVQEEERRKTEIIKGGLTGASFNPDQDKDKDGINDFLEIAKHGLDADTREKEHDLNREKFEHDKTVEERKMDQDDEKIKNEKAKIKEKKV